MCYTVLISSVFRFCKEWVLILTESITCATIKTCQLEPQEMRDSMSFSLICIYLLWWWASTGQKLPGAVCLAVSMSQCWLGARDAKEIQAACLLNIPCYQWQASTGEYTFNGRRDRSQRNSQTGDTRALRDASERAVISQCFLFVQIFCLKYGASLLLQHRWCVKNV